jgi:hypothetical protein
MKTGDAEIRGLENLSKDVKKRITPLIELTPSRVSKNMPDGDINRRLKRLKEAYGDREFILDLTADANLSNRQIEDLQNTHDGYVNWIDFLVSLQKDFSKIIPVIQISDKNIKSEKEYYARIKQQVHSLDGYFDDVVYRFPLEYESYIDDLKEICKAISGDKIICVVDAKFIPQAKAVIYSQTVEKVITELEQFSLGKIVVSATSFPKNPTENGGDEYGDSNLEEWALYNIISKKTSVIYGDYASINPIRSLQAGGNGWVPRIDMPAETLFFYHRSRKVGSSYVPAYIRVAQAVQNDEKYDDAAELSNSCWGLEQIESAAEGNPPGLSPSFWISVRMNIHMTIRDTLLS